MTEDAHKRNAAAGLHPSALLASALGVGRSASMRESVVFFETRHQDITKVAVMKLLVFINEVLGVLHLIKVHRVR